MSSIIYYNPRRIWENVKNNNSIINNEADIVGWQALTGLTRNSVSYFDKTNTIPHFLNNTMSMRQFSYDPNFNLSLTDIFRARWQYFINKFNKINILWSGGADSTVIVVAAIKYLTYEQLKKITIYFTDRSVKENPKFVNSIFIQSATKYPFKLQRFSSGNLSNLLYEYKDDEIYISGEYGDQIFTSSVLNSAYTSKFDIYYDSYENIVDEKILRFLEPQMKNCPHKLYSFYDFTWWLGISMKNQDVALRIQYLTGNPNVYAFFDSYNFDQYAIQTNKNSSISDKQIYKKPFNEFIANFVNEYYHYTYLEKTPSLDHVEQFDKQQDHFLYFHQCIFDNDYWFK